MHQEYQETDGSYQSTNQTNQLSQFGQLYVQGRLYPRQLGSLASHMTYLRCIAYCTHNESARTSQHHRTAKHLILSISLVRLADILVSNGILGKLVRHRLTRQARFIHLQVGGLIQHSVGRYLITRLHKYHIANNHLTTRNLHDCSLANHLNRLFFTQLRQHVELAGSVALKVKTNGSSQYDSSNNADSLDEITFYESQD